MAIFRKSSFLDVKGVCLTEVVVSFTIGAIVVAAALDIFNVVEKVAVSQHHTLRQQQDLRLGLEVLEQEVRLSTADSIVNATKEQLLFFANIHGQQTTITGPAVPGQTVLTVENGSGWGDGKSVTICGRQACEVHRLSRTGQRYQLTLAEPVQSMFPAGASVEVTNRVVYYTKANEQGAMNLMRMVDGGASVLIGDLKAAHFSYRDKQNRLTELPSEVRRVIVEIESNHIGRSISGNIALRS